MKRLFYYCIYRIASAYKKMKMQDYIAQGYFLMFFAFTGYLLTLLQCVLFHFGLRLNETLIFIFCIPVLTEVLFFNKLFPNHEKINMEYDFKYRHEPFKWLKGIFVFLFLLLSILSYIFVLYIQRPDNVG